MALLPPPDIGAAYVDESKRPSKDFYNWIKSLYDYTRKLTSGGGGGTPAGAVGQVQYNAGTGVFGGYTNAQVTSLLDLFTAAPKGVVPASGGGTLNFLRADGSWVVPPGGSGTTPGGSNLQVQYNNAGAFGGYSGTQVTALLDPFTTALKGVVPPPITSSSTTFLRDDGSWAVPPTGSGGGSVSSVSNADGSLTITPITGPVVASMNMANHNTWTTGQTFTRIFFGTADGFGVNDTSSLASNSGTFWDSNLHRFNRAYIGLAATVDSNDVPQSSHVLPSTYNFAWTQNSQLGVMSSMGLNAVTATSRASDWVTFSSTASQGSQAFTGFGFNDDTVTSGSIAVGGNFIGVAVPGCTGITLGVQNDINSACTPVTIDPFTGFPSGTTIGTLSTSGAYASAATQNCSAAYVVAQGNTALFNAGLVVMAGSLAQPGGAKGVAVALPQDYALIWYTNAGVKAGSIFVDPSGNMNITCTGVLRVNGVAVTVP